MFKNGYSYICKLLNTSITKYKYTISDLPSLTIIIIPGDISKT